MLADSGKAAPAEAELKSRSQHAAAPAAWHRMQGCLLVHHHRHTFTSTVAARERQSLVCHG